MILPTKHISLHNSYLGVGRTVLSALDCPMTVRQLWKKVGSEENVSSSRRFFRALDFLYAIGAIDLMHGKLQRRVHAAQS